MACVGIVACVFVNVIYIFVVYIAPRLFNTYQTRMNSHEDSIPADMYQALV